MPEWRLDQFRQYKGVVVHRELVAEIDRLRAANETLTEQVSEMDAIKTPLYSDRIQGLESRIKTLTEAAQKAEEALEALDANWRIGKFSGPEDPRALARFTDATIDCWRKMVSALAALRSAKVQCG